MDIEKKIFINGNEFSIDKDLTINDILEYFNSKNSLFVIEYNNLICHQNEWSKIRIKDNDKIEIISIVGGG